MGNRQYANNTYVKYLIRKYDMVQEETEFFLRVKNEEIFQIECGYGRSVRTCYLRCNLTFESKQPKGRVIGWAFQNDQISWAEGMGKVGGRRAARRKALAYFRKRKPLLAKRYE